MLKANAKRRLSKAEYAEKKRLNANKEAALAEKLARIQELEDELDAANHKASQLDSHVELLNNLQAQGHI
jgi:hypothetical protein